MKFKKNSTASSCSTIGGKKTGLFLTHLFQNKKGDKLKPSKTLMAKIQTASNTVVRARMIRKIAIPSIMTPRMTNNSKEPFKSQIWRMKLNLSSIRAWKTDHPR